MCLKVKGMFDGSRIVVGLDIGTSKVCAVVGEWHESGPLQIIGLGLASTLGGVRKGEIVNTELVEDATRLALAEAENQSDVEIDSVYLGITGSHVKGINGSGVHLIPSIDREIDKEDIRHVVTAAQPQISTEYKVLHTVGQVFRVDGQGDIKNPLGRMASRLEVDVHVVYGQRNRIQNPLRLIKGLGIKVEDFAFNGRVMALPVLTAQLGEQGVLVLDIGAGTSEYAVYLNGSIRHCGVLAIGGEHVTNDLSVGLKISLSRAESLKLSNGNAVCELENAHRTVNLSKGVGVGDKQILLGDLHRIMNARLEELFQLIKSDLERQNLIGKINGGILLSGGVSRTPRIGELAQEVFQLNVLTSAEHSAEKDSRVLRPETLTSIGLAEHAVKRLKAAGSRKNGFFKWLTQSK